jgi:pyruvate kinase
MAMKSTKIVCTIGPKSHNEQTIIKMAKAGMNIARMNFSHGSYNFHKETIRITRKVSKTLDIYIGILLDLQGPKIRTGKLEKETVTLNKGERIVLTSEDSIGDWEQLSINYDRLPKEARIGERILLDDGNIELKVTGIGEKSIECKILNGGIIRSYRGVNLPDTSISTPSLTPKDIDDLNFGLDHGIDYIALSFVRSPQDILDVKDIIERKGARIPVVAKIEKPEAIKNINKIISISDAVMVARGDLGAETSPQDVPILQKMIIKKCNVSGVPVITATQMLESMISRPRPTRAEASDVANAIFDGTDAVMLSGETALGEYAVGAVKVMSRIAEKAEGEIDKKVKNFERTAKNLQKGNIADALCFSANMITDLINPKYIVSFTLSGNTAIIMSKHRPSVPIIAMSPDVEVLRRLSLYWGVYGVRIDTAKNTEDLLGSAERKLIEKGLCKEEDTVIIIGGVPVLAGEPTNMLKVQRVNISRRNI